MAEHTAKELCDIQVWDFTQTNPLWAVIREIILKKINNAKDNCFDAVGEVSDLERGIGTGLNDFLIDIEARASNGQKLAQGEPD